MPVDIHALMDAARAVQQRAHAPSSNYRVGAAVLDEDGNVHVGCNVENASYPEGICAEANAIGSMVAAGGRRIAAIAIVGSAADGAADRFATDVGPCTPCGGCRQRILEFADDDTKIHCHDAAGKVQTFSVAELLPHAFQANPGP